MIVDKTQRDIAKLTALLRSPRIAEGLSQLNDLGAEDLILGAFEEVSDNFILEGIGFDRPKGATVNWSHKSGGGMQGTYVSFPD